MKRTRAVHSALAATGLLLICGAAVAQDGEVSGSGIGIAPGLRLEPSVKSQLWFTDNMYRSDDNETDAMGLIVEPAAVLAYSPSYGRYRLGFLGEAASFDTVDEDNYFDSQLFLTGDLRPLLRHRFEFDARYEHGHDAFGTNRTQGQAALRDREMDIWDETGLTVKYIFGQSEALLNLYGRAGITGKEYDTNRQDPVNPALGTRFLDHDSTLIGGGVIYRLSAKTRFVVDVEQKDIDYDIESTPSFDGDSQRALLGVRWLATAKTSGEAMVGYYARNFDDDGREDVSGIDWQVRVDWRPRLRSNFTLTTGRFVRETFLLGEDFINEQYAQLGWRQDWSERLYSETELGYFQHKFEGTSRDDDTVALRSALYYRMTRRITAKGGFEHTTRDSSTTSLDFQRNVLFTGLDVAL
ncbi:MAG TPA: outer membrane beta-barrel protein [Solimonas sp.]|nr:outer membrane beta-barrel protein [Solimonas sp.]